MMFVLSTAIIVLFSTFFRASAIAKDTAVSKNRLSKDPCCYDKNCGNIDVCLLPGKVLQSSCKTSQQFSVQPDCSLKSASCCYVDKCNKSNKVCKAEGEEFKDSCGKSYQVGSNCKLVTSDCCFKDPCNHENICAPKNGTLKNSCPHTYQVSDQCELSGRCRIRDSCNSKRAALVSNKGGLVTDECEHTYQLSNKCALSSLTCCASNKCKSNGERQCARLDLSQSTSKRTFGNSWFCAGFKGVLQKKKDNRCVSSDKINPFEITALGTIIGLEETLQNFISPSDFKVSSTEIYTPKESNEETLQSKTVINYRPCNGKNCRIGFKIVMKEEAFESSIFDAAITEFKNSPEYNLLYSSPKQLICKQRSLMSTSIRTYACVCRFHNEMIHCFFNLPFWGCSPCST